MLFYKFIFLTGLNLLLEFTRNSDKFKLAFFPVSSMKIMNSLK